MSNAARVVLCDVYSRRVGQSGNFILAENVSPDVAGKIIAAQGMPGFVTWRVDKTEESATS